MLSSPEETRAELVSSLSLPPPLSLAKARALHDGDVFLFIVCSFLCSSVICESCEVIRYVAAPGDERNFTCRPRYIRYV